MIHNRVYIFMNHGYTHTYPNKFWNFDNLRKILLLQLDSDNVVLYWNAMQN